MGAIDWDSLFAYQTVKIVKIRDKRLGILHICFMLAIVIYIAIGTIVLQKRYLATELPIGSIRTSLLANCNLAVPNCTFVSPTSTEFYIADIDNFTILLDHTLSAPSLGIQYNARQLPEIQLFNKFLLSEMTPQCFCLYLDCFEVAIYKGGGAFIL
eukprot:gene12304-14431_t